jgi:hypothetical protein
VRQGKGRGGGAASLIRVTWAATNTVAVAATNTVAVAATNTVAVAATNTVAVAAATNTVASLLVLPHNQRKLCTRQVWECECCKCCCTPATRPVLHLLMLLYLLLRCLLCDPAGMVCMCRGPAITLLTHPPRASQCLQG